MSVKPSDFVISLVDIFGILLPGAMLCFLFLPEGIWLLSKLDVQIEKGYQEWIVFIVASYILGHYIAFFGRTLRIGYHRLSNLTRKWEKLFAFAYGSEDILRKYVRGQMSQALRGAGDVYLCIHPADWALSFIRQRNPLTAAQINRLSSSARFFVNFIVVLLIVCMKWVASGNLLFLAATLVLVLFSSLIFLRLASQISLISYKEYIMSQQHLAVEIPTKLREG